ncbi:MAG: carbohydrate binding domain-containing protein [Lachnospiraceae bacterium]|nr:carbohydrate binding domain-containing protein [Lachnospiraceae bacterium]
MKQIKVYQNDNYKELGDLYGLFFEDINHAADGGLYAELVQNRSFEYCEIDKKEYHSLTAWEKSDALSWEVISDRPLNEENRNYLRVEASEGSFIRNTGYNTGVYVESGKKYDFSVFARTIGAAKTVTVTVVDEADNVCAAATEVICVSKDEWTKYELELTASTTTYNGRLKLTFEAAGVYEFDMVSLFPQDTFMGRKGGLRKDIAEALKEMKPKFMRFPGGCLTHDGSLNDHDRNSMYRWRRTLGKVEERPTWRNNWGYNQTLGLGYYEYFCLCEDIGAKPLPVLPGGFNPHKGEGVPIENIGEWVQEALDLIEFANGGVDTKYGAIRAEMGHPEPFNMEYIGIGNEEIGDGFFERYPYFHNAIREKYPDIKIINSAGPFAVGEGYDAGWTSAKMYGSDLVDEHYYSSPEWFLANMHHYEDYDANGPKVFLGEYASWGNTYYNALVEAAYMTHLERSKAVALACYAPMLCNVDYVNWRPDMLWFNNHEIMKTPNYYVQKMFMEHQGTDAVRYELTDLSEIIKLGDKENLAGKIAIAANDVTGKIWDMKLTDCDTNEVKTAEDVELTDNSEHLFFEIDETKKFALEFKFKRSTGRKGLKIFFGKTENSVIMWEFGGWDNWDCNISSIVNGRASAISHRIFHVEDIEYTLRLEADGRSIKTYVNGELYNNTTDRLPELEEVYVAASTDSATGETVLKVVNLTGEDKNIDVVLDGDSKTKVESISLEGHELSAVNSFENPDNICLKNDILKINDNKLNHTFKAHSVTVLVFGA